MRPEGLFDLDAEPTLGCDDWLGQQVVIFDGSGVSLKEVMRTRIERRLRW